MLIRDVDVEDDDEDEQRQDESERITWETEMTWRQRGFLTEATEGL